MRLLSEQPYLLIFDNINSKARRIGKDSESTPPFETALARFLEKLLKKRSYVILASRSSENWIPCDPKQCTFVLEGLDLEAVSVLARNVLDRNNIPEERLNSDKNTAIYFEHVLHVLQANPSGIETILPLLAKYTLADIFELCLYAKSDIETINIKDWDSRLFFGSDSFNFIKEAVQSLLLVTGDCPLELLENSLKCIHDSVSPGVVENFLSTLEDLGLAERRQSETVVAIHPLLPIFVRHRFAEALVNTELLDRLVEAFCGFHFENSADCWKHSLPQPEASKYHGSEFEILNMYTVLATDVVNDAEYIKRLISSPFFHHLRVMGKTAPTRPLYLEDRLSEVLDNLAQQDCRTISYCLVTLRLGESLWRLKSTWEDHQGLRKQENWFFRFGKEEMRISDKCTVGILCPSFLEDVKKAKLLVDSQQLVEVYSTAMFMSLRRTELMDTLLYARLRLRAVMGEESQLYRFTCLSNFPAFLNIAFELAKAAGYHTLATSFEELIVEVNTTVAVLQSQIENDKMASFEMALKMNQKLMSERFPGQFGKTGFAFLHDHGTEQAREMFEAEISARLSEKRFEDLHLPCMGLIGIAVENDEWRKAYEVWKLLDKYNGIPDTQSREMFGHCAQHSGNIAEARRNYYKIWKQLIVTPESEIVDHQTPLRLLVLMGSTECQEGTDPVKIRPIARLAFIEGLLRSKREEDGRVRTAFRLFKRVKNLETILYVYIQLRRMCNEVLSGRKTFTGAREELLRNERNALQDYLERDGARWEERMEREILM